MESFCQYYREKLCGSCTWMEIPYRQQLLRKEKLLCDALAAEQMDLYPTIASPTLGFRNRAKMSVTGTADEPVVGLVGDQELDRGQTLLDCPIHHPRLNEVIRALPGYIREFRLIPYSIGLRTGELKGVISYYSPLSETMYLRFVLRSQECVARIRKLLPKLRAEFGFLTCISANIQPIPHAILEGKQEIILTPESTIPHLFLGQPLRLSPQGFVQTNFSVAEKLARTAAEWVREMGGKRLADLFCGQGAFSFAVQGQIQAGIGVEVNAASVQTAQGTAQSLNLRHLQFVSGEATQLISQVERFGADVFLVNPPRRGIGELAAEILRLRPAQLLYSSCAVDSLAKDIRSLKPHYRVKRVQIFDLFPHTEHFETLAWLTLQ